MDGINTIRVFFFDLRQEIINFSLVLPLGNFLFLPLRFWNIDKVIVTCALFDQSESRTFVALGRLKGVAYVFLTIVPFKRMRKLSRLAGNFFLRTFLIHSADLLR
jgi:hypothetical protein